MTALLHSRQSRQAGAKPRQRYREENEPERIGDELACLQRVADSDRKPDDHPTKGKPSDKPNETVLPNRAATVSIGTMRNRS